MTQYMIRPHEWEEQFAASIWDAKDGDELWLPDQFAAETARQAIERWGIKTKVEVFHMPQAGNCRRCGGQRNGNFCDSCKQGKLHAQDCPKLWDCSEDPTMIEMAQEGPCNCGGDALYNAGRDGTH